MKRFLIRAFFFTLATFFALPTAFGIADSWCYVVLGRTITGVEWTSTTVSLTWAMLIPVIGCVLAGSLVAEARG